jgi:hypothetical protein
LSIRPSNLRNSKSCKLYVGILKIYAGILKTAIFLGNSRETRTKVIAWKPLFLHIYIYIKIAQKSCAFQLVMNFMFI